MQKRAQGERAVFGRPFRHLLKDTSDNATANLPLVPLIIAAQAAEVLDVDVQQVYNLASRGVLMRHSPKHARGQTYDLQELERHSLALLKYHDHGQP